MALIIIIIIIIIINIVVIITTTTIINIIIIIIIINSGSLESFEILYVTASMDKHAATVSSMIAKPSL